MNQSKRTANNTHSARLPISAKTVAKSATVSIALAALLASSGCATSSLLDNDTTRTTSSTVSNVISEDQIVAFGRPAQPLPNLPTGNMVIVGEKNSYVLIKGGTEMVNLLTNLTAKNIKVENDMNFDVPNNDGYFQGQMKLSYAKLKDEFDRADYQFFLQNGGQDCSSASDMRINAQRFCFSVPVQGAIYPKVSNLSLIQSKYRPLSKPYTVKFHTRTEQNTVNRTGRNGAEKLILLPFAVAFDVVTFPVQVLDSIANQ